MKHLLLLLLAAACAGGEPKKKPDIDDTSIGDSSISNANFSKPKPLVYQAQDDHYTAKPDGRVLQTESAERAADRNKQEKEPLMAMMAACYDGKFADAFAVADKIYASHQNLPTYWNQVATCHLLQGNERKALLFYNKALEVTSQYVPALNNIAVMYQKSGQDQKAMVALQRAYKNGRFAKTPRFNLAHHFLSYNLANEALPLFRGLSEEAPGDVDVIVGLANCYALLGRWQDAWNEFARVPAKSRRRSDVGLNMALTAHRLGRSSEAKEILSATATSGAHKEYAEKIRVMLEK